MKALGGAHSGTGAWLLQRASAVVLALALPLLALRLLAAQPGDFAGWQALFAPLGMRVVVLLTCVVLALHAWVGMRDILMDYVRPTGLRLALYVAVITVLAGSVAWLVALLGGLQ
jgi:succinate dehydrogenase / fumarate reductase membrane anchor subunit